MVLLIDTKTRVGAAFMHVMPIVDVAASVTSSAVSLPSMEAIRIESELEILHHTQVFHVGALWQGSDKLWCCNFESYAFYRCYYISNKFSCFITN